MADRVFSGEIWREFIAALEGLGSLVLADDVPARPQDRAEGWRYLLRFLGSGIRVVVPAGDPDYPEFCRMIENGMSWGLDNPDCNYSWARVRGDASYRIGGNRGSARHLEFQVNTGHFGDGNVGGWRTVSSIHGRELVSEPDGSFEIVLSPEPQPGNWMALDPDASFLLLRQYMSDWENERPADLFIERIDAEYPQPALTPERIAARMDELVTWLSAGARSWENMSRLILATPPNQIEMTKPLEGNAGLRGQSYGLGHYECGPDEAVIVEFEPPECLMWGVQLSGWFWESMEFGARQSSLNGSQAVLDSDGMFRGVIAHVDPCVPNWIDPEGHESGTIGIRYLFPDRVTQPTFRTVPVAAVREALPEATPAVSPDERRRTLERRRRSVQLRYRY
ncbi:MAG: hypothetical protein P8R42_23200 [Candidatus Binatia bacterium]|nr:hypothetical protein [Candidatus Binatia bacterium]